MGLPDRTANLPLEGSDSTTSASSHQRMHVVMGLAHAQSDFLCPPNNKMGLCEPVPNTCFHDQDCPADHICCPEACTRSCKPKMAPGQRSQPDVPDLLNDPRVYIGQCPDSGCFSLFNSEPDQCSTSHTHKPFCQCPDSGCFSLFNSEPDQCSTSNLCRPEQFCCHDGCKNVCLWKPPYAAILAKVEAQRRYQQQVLYQAEQKKKQEEAYREEQRRRAEMEQARRAARARAEAEAVLAAQKAKAEYQAKMQAKADAQAQAVSRLQQKMAQQQAASLLQQQQQQQQQQQPTSWTGQAQKSGGGDISLGGFFDALKKDKLAGTLTNQINSPANSINPYTAAGGAVNSLDKGGYSAAYDSSAGKQTGGSSSAISRALAELIMPANIQINQYSSPAMKVAPPTGNIAPPTRSNQAWSRAPSSQPVRLYSYQAAPQTSGMNNQYNQQPQQQQLQQQLLQQQQQQRHHQQPVEPLLMYHFMQAA
ncbi:hypothetical protein EGW08_020545 [Elysia chlorotica]|uniref:WAP domain-containing protein n=1 Tax=Elysia chlorotica TaxID=188477 RepID=A0A3S1H3V4_ELYCH|nr:hypothetical protein EGW08_020545 [Elysia chlorotica]